MNTSARNIVLRMKSLGRLRRTAALVAVVALSLTAAGTRHLYSPREKAAYADAATVEFVRPGLVIKINSAQIAADGTITVTYGLTDPSGLPLDSAGVTTPGTMKLSYVAAVLPKDDDGYTAYTTTATTGKVIPLVNRPSADSGGVTTAIAAGQYQYVFHTKAPSGFDATATHTIGIYGSRVLTDFNLGTNYASAVFNFVPNGAKVTKVHDVIKTPKLQFLPRSVVVPWRIAPRDRNVRALSYRAECGSEYREVG